PRPRAALHCCQVCAYMGEPARLATTERDKANCISAQATLLSASTGFTDAPSASRWLRLFRGAQRVGVAVDLQPRDPEAGDAVAVDRHVRGEKLLHRQIVP